jgi:hypothetical protein
MMRVMALRRSPAWLCPAGGTANSNSVNSHMGVMLPTSEAQSGQGGGGRGGPKGSRETADGLMVMME